MPKSQEFDLRPDTFTGQKFGQYEVICQLSVGGMSEIFLAVRRGEAGFQKLVVLKRILPAIAEDEEYVARLLDEGNLMGSFSHPNIAQVFDVGRDGDQFFLVMEFVAGVSLVELLHAAKAANEPVPVGFTLAVGRAAAQALHHAHAFVDAAGQPRPVIHRDVAPKNIMVTYEGDTKLLDFGVAKTSLNKTNAGTLIGTPSYMSPEQVTLNPLDARSDVFSLAVTLHECLTGQKLFAGESMNAQLRAVMEREIARPSALNPEVPRELDDAILHALARPREDRFATARDFSRALEAAAGSQLWGAERCAAVVERFFGDRRERTRGRLQALRSEAGVPNDASPTIVERPSKAVAPGEPTERTGRPRRALVAIVASSVVVAAAIVFVMRPPPDPVAAPIAREVAAVAEPALAPEEHVEAPAPQEPAPQQPAPARPVLRTVAPQHRAAVPAPAKAVAASGSLWVKVRPWARVFVDGRLRGETPLDPFAVSAGHHTVLLLNDQLKLRKTYEVDVRPNEAQEVKAVLDE